MTTVAAPQDDDPKNNKNDNARDRRTTSESKSGFSELLPKPTLYYDKISHHYWMPDANGNWTSIIEGAASDLLKEAGLRGATKGDELISPLDIEMNRIRFECGVDYADPLSGFRTGVFDVGERKVLVPRTFKLITPRRGEFKNIQAIIEGLFGEEQMPYVLAWIKLAYEALREGSRRAGHALVFQNSAELIFPENTTISFSEPLPFYP